MTRFFAGTEGAISLAPGVLARLQQEAEQAGAQECCGLLLGHDGVIEQVAPTTNIAADPFRHFEIDPQALVDAHRAARAGGPQVAGYYHSHPVGAAEPSATDRAQAAGDGSVWAIIARGDVTFWHDGKVGFARLPIRPPCG